MENAQNHRDAVIELLKAEKLPVEDLPASLEHFVTSKENGMLTGVGGLEIYGNYGLLRSLAVHPEHRNKGIAGTLLSDIENRARAIGLHQLFLLTETAAAYFSAKGFSQVSRELVPEEIRSSSEFSNICPQSAIVMSKQL
jgi:amino-acid N-acetyltransferase